MTELTTQPPEGIRVILNEEDVTDIQAIIEGPCKFNIVILRPMERLSRLYDEFFIYKKKLEKRYAVVRP